MQPNEIVRIAKMLRRERTRLNLTMGEVAQLADVDRTTIIRLENAQLVSPRIGTLAKIGRVLGISSTALFPGNAPMSANDLPGSRPICAPNTTISPRQTFKS